MVIVETSLRVAYVHGVFFHGSTAILGSQLGSLVKLELLLGEIHCFGELVVNEILHLEERLFQ